jgi:hypothetical protein
MMAQKFGPWEDAVTREAYQNIIAIVREYKEVNVDDTDCYIDPADALRAIAEVINETEGTDL